MRRRRPAALRGAAAAFAAVAVAVAVAVAGVACGTREARAATAAPAETPAEVERAGGNRLRLDWVQVDRRQAIERLAALTGSRLTGIEGLPRDLGTVTLREAAIDVAAALQRLLDGTPAGYALACGARACRVAFAAAGAPATSTGGLRPAATRAPRPAVAFSEAEN